jgi:hypothetical protein
MTHLWKRQCRRNNSISVDSVFAFKYPRGVRFFVGCGVYMTSRQVLLTAIHTTIFCFSISAEAQSLSDAPLHARSFPDTVSQPAPDEEETEAKDSKSEVPRLAYTDSVLATRGSLLGVGVFGAARGYMDKSSGNPVGGGGLQIFGSPIERVMIVAVGERTLDGDFRPTASVIVRLAGGRKDGWAIGGIASYKMDGFAEAGGETELGAVFSIAQKGWHLDANAIAGSGLEEKEVDTEGKLRGGVRRPSMASTWL